jgi:hypothetical protein
MRRNPSFFAGVLTALAAAGATTALAVALNALAASVACAQQQAPDPVQTARDRYQEAYRNWRQSDPMLERDVTSGAPGVAARADKVSSEAVQYFAARRAYTELLRKDAVQNASALDPLPVPSLQHLLAEVNVPAAISAVESSIKTVGASDADPGLRQLRQALEREKAALIALSAHIETSSKARSEAARAMEQAASIQSKVAAQYRALAAEWEQESSSGAQLSAAWSAYYRALSGAARAFPEETPPRELPPPGPARASSAAVVPPGATGVAGATSPPPPTPAAATPPAALPRAALFAPQSRYVGAWTYPRKGGIYRGAELVSADLVISDESGTINGMLTARFKLPRGTKGDSDVRLTFGGPFRNAGFQSFPVKTSNGAGGTIELIPGPALYMIEVNFSTNDTVPAVHDANFLLVRK